MSATLAVVLAIAACLVVAVLVFWFLGKEKKLKQFYSQELDSHRGKAEEYRQLLTSKTEGVLGKAHIEAEQLIEEAKKTAQQLTSEARSKADLALEQSRQDLRSEQEEMTKLFARREDRLAQREDRLNQDKKELEKQTEHLTVQLAEIDNKVKTLDAVWAQHRQELTRISGLNEAEAKAELMATFEHEARLAAAARIRDIERDAQRDGEKRARKLIVTAMQRVASDQTAESTVAAVDLPSEEMKGRIIGREGRNIRTFEQVSGVNIIIDDTPGMVLLSCFDPVRREVARLALSDLVQDGRIHPTRIESAIARAEVEVEEIVRRAAEDALAEMKITDFSEDLIPVLGALRFRTSYGQNVLRHLVECGHLAAAMAAEMGLDIDICRRAAFLHDIGKALTHETDGSHALVGADLLRKHGESDDVVHAVAAHHNEIEPETVEAILVQVCDTCSGSRPGARRESLESYVQRLERLEEIALSHEGVDRVFAMQSGRDVRVMVRPGSVSDDDAAVLAQEVASQIEHELTYPGQIRVTVVRESRAIGIAH
ncbi:MAG: ribonuclease Y [Propionibacteriaceae bacterium]